MIYADYTFPYGNYKGKGQLFETYATESYIDKDNDDDDVQIEWQIDYSKELGMYRITRFRNNHWDCDLVFDEIEKEYNAYCPVCDEDRYIPNDIGYCYKCGHHLNRK